MSRFRLAACLLGLALALPVRATDYHVGPGQPLAAIGDAPWATLAPGEDHALGFGVDDRIKVSRTQVHRETSESGIINTDIVEERSWVMEVQNLHVRTMPVRIYDRLPFATHEDIKVDLLATSTRPSERNVDNRQGILAWDYKLAGGEEKVIRFGFRVASCRRTQLRSSREPSSKA